MVKICSNRFFSSLMLNIQIKILMSKYYPNMYTSFPQRRQKKYSCKIFFQRWTNGLDIYLNKQNDTYITTTYLYDLLQQLKGKVSYTFSIFCEFKALLLNDDDEGERLIDFQLQWFKLSGSSCLVHGGGMWKAEPISLFFCYLYFP